MDSPETVWCWVRSVSYTHLDCKAPTASYQDFIKNENRYNRLAQANPERAAKLFEEAEENAKAKFERLTKYGKLYE